MKKAGNCLKKIRHQNVNCIVLHKMLKLINDVVFRCPVEQEVIWPESLVFELFQKD